MDRPHPAGRAAQQQPQHPARGAGRARARQHPAPRLPGRSDRAGPLAGRGRQGQRVARAGSGAQGQCSPGGQRAAPCGALRGVQASRSPPHCWAPCWAGSSSTSCPACSRCWRSRWWALPATRKTGAPTASAAWPTPPGWCCPSSRWAPSCWACGRRARPWDGAFSCSRPPWWLRWPGCSPLIGLNLAGVFRVWKHAAVISGQPAGAPPGGRQLLDRRARRGRGIALHGAVHGRLQWASRPRCLPRRRWRCLQPWAWAWRCPTWPPACGPPWRAPCPAPARGWTPSAASWPSHVRHRGVAGVGAGRQQSGIDGAASLLILLVGLGLLAWSLALQGRARRWLAALRRWPWRCCCGPWPPCHAHGRGGGSPANATATAAQGWQPWAPGAAEALVASGRPVFVDFTAAWCVTCQYNRKPPSPTAEVLADLHARTSPCCARTGPAATRPSPPPWPSWAAMGCRCMCLTAQASPRWC